MKEEIKNLMKFALSKKTEAQRRLNEPYDEIIYWNGYLQALRDVLLLVDDDV